MELMKPTRDTVELLRVLIEQGWSLADALWFVCRSGVDQDALEHAWNERP